LTLRDADSLWFAVPSVGPFLVALERARRELHAALKRRPYGEIMEKVWPGVGRSFNAHTHTHTFSHTHTHAQRERERVSE
jgi:hypothetical protein